MSLGGGDWVGDWLGMLDVVSACLSGIVGDSHVDIKEGIRKGHALVKDSPGLCTGVNYGITTNPKIEYLLLAGFMVPGRE